MSSLRTPDSAGPDASLIGLLQSQESEYLEKKREWWDLATQVGKGKCTRSVLALANSARVDKPSHLLIGIDDDRHGGTIVGLDRLPDAEQLAHTLSHYTQPVPSIRVRAFETEGKQLAALEVHRSDNWPYYASRDIDGELSSDVVYVRVGPTISRLKPAELEQWIRQKELRVGALPPTEALAVGFVERGSWHGANGPVLRVTNRSGESLRDIFVVFDVSAPYDLCFTAMRV